MKIARYCLYMRRAGHEQQPALTQIPQHGSCSMARRRDSSFHACAVMIKVGVFTTVISDDTVGIERCDPVSTFDESVTEKQHGRVPGFWKRTPLPQW